MFPKKLDFWDFFISFRPMQPDLLWVPCAVSLCTFGHTAPHDYWLTFLALRKNFQAIFDVIPKQGETGSLLVLVLDTSIGEKGTSLQIKGYFKNDYPDLHCSYMRDGFFIRKKQHSHIPNCRLEQILKHKNLLY